VAGPVNWRTLRHAAQLAWSCSRAEVVFLICATTIASLTVPLVIWLTEVLINRVVSVGHHGAPVSMWLPWAAALGLSFAAQRIFPTFLQNHQRLLGEQIRQYVETTLLAASSRVQLGSMENPEWHDTMLRASRSAGRQSSLVLGYLQIYGALIASVSMLGILLSLNPLLVLIALGLILASAPQQYFQARIIYELYDRATSNERERMYIRLLLTESFATKDIQAHRLAPSLLRRYEILARNWLGQFRTAMRRVDYYTIITGVIIAVLGLAGYIFLISRGIAGTISAGGVAAAIGGFASLGGQFSSISLGAMTIAENTKFLDDLLAFVPDAPVTNSTPAATLPEPTPVPRQICLSEGITFDNEDYSGLLVEL
jgi:ATP-binding cassette subfamily B protein